MPTALETLRCLKFGVFSPTPTSLCCICSLEFQHHVGIYADCPATKKKTMPRGRPKKTIASTIITSPAVLKPLESNKKIKMFLFISCTENSSDKVYIFVHWKKNKKEYLSRFWGRFGSGSLQVITDPYNVPAFQSLIDEKAQKGYRKFSDAAITDNETVFAGYVNQINATINIL